MAFLLFLLDRTGQAANCSQIAHPGQKQDAMSAMVVSLGVVLVSMGIVLVSMGVDNCPEMASCLFPGGAIIKHFVSSP